MSEEGNYSQRRFRLAANATEVVLVRHGATTDAVPGEPFALSSDGHGDPSLSPLGEEQALAVGARLARNPPALLTVTTLRRTTQTAAPLVAATGLAPLVVPELREVHLGDWEAGEWRIRMANGDPIAMRVLTEQRWDLIPGAEDTEAFAARVRAGVHKVAAAAGLGRSAVAVVHGGVIGELCRQATDSRPFAFIHAENGSLTRLVVWEDGGVTLQGFNDTSHL
ncbi:MAG: histidine phosphatase family protein [Solirubrobacterales bacterium]|nr:histidine phosphatase family protein [Solirubrobacterales bacterium]